MNHAKRIQQSQRSSLEMKMRKRESCRSSILAFLPKAAAAPVNFSSPPPSPVRAGGGRGSSGPMISLVPREARRRARHGSFDAREPASPEVSCIGRIKSKNKKKQQREIKVAKPCEMVLAAWPKVIMKVFVGRQQDRKSGGDVCHEIKPPVPSLSDLKSIASGRRPLQNFDWREAHVDGKEVGDGEIVVEARKEINLWERRTIAPPLPLQL